MSVTSLSKERLTARRHEAIAAEHDLIAEMIEASARDDNDPARGVVWAVLLAIPAWVVVAVAAYRVIFQ